VTGKPPYRDAEATPIVLRDVVVQGHVALARPGDRHASAPQLRPQGPSLVPIQASHRAEPRLAGTPSASEGVMAAEPAVQAAGVQVEEEARRRGHEEGLAKGLAEGRERAAEDARQAAAQAEQQAVRELDARAERLTQELQKQAQAAVGARVQALNSLIDGLPPQIEARLSAAEDDMLALCFETVCHMLGEATVQPGLVRAQLAHAMSRLRTRRLVAIHLHPDDLAALQRVQDVTASGLPGGEDVQWIASAEVALGGCILQSPEGGLDARFETQLHALRDLLLQSRALARHREA
jgi:flagellar assembly protein FliH